MALDDELVRQARDAATRMIDAERDVDRARGDYYHAIRKLHLTGGSMREIAIALDLSHQRVHQIVESVGGARRRWRRPANCDPKNLSCSFCGLDQKKARKLVAGPGVYICNECIAVATGVVTEGREARNKRTAFEPINASSGRRCSFCRKATARVGGMAGVADVAVCGACLELCRDIVAERRMRA